MLPTFVFRALGAVRECAFLSCLFASLLYLFGRRDQVMLHAGLWFAGITVATQVLMLFLRAIVRRRTPKAHSS